MTFFVFESESQREQLKVWLDGMDIHFLTHGERDWLGRWVMEVKNRQWHTVATIIAGRGLRLAGSNDRLRDAVVDVVCSIRKNFISSQQVDELVRLHDMAAHYQAALEATRLLTNQALGQHHVLDVIHNLATGALASHREHSTQNKVGA